MDNVPEKIRWNEAYRVGAPIIDNDHRRLIGILNDLSRAVDLGKGEMVLGAILARLQKYTEFHFRNEELWMAEIGYPALEEHRALHGDLKKSVLDYRARFESGERLALVEMLNFLSDWLVNHIQGEDLKISRWLAETSPTAVAPPK